MSFFASQSQGIPYMLLLISYFYIKIYLNFFLLKTIIFYYIFFYTINFVKNKIYIFFLKSGEYRIWTDNLLLAKQVL